MICAYYGSAYRVRTCSGFTIRVEWSKCVPLVYDLIPLIGR